MRSLCEFSVDPLAEELRRRGHNPRHAVSLLRRFFETGGTGNFDGLGLGIALLSELRSGVRRSRVVQRVPSADGTIKQLVQFDDGGTVESVMMPAYQEKRAAGCVSSQIGCAMGCDFCASTKNGLVRNLDAGEIVEQYVHLCAEALAQGRRLNTLVYMGMGEPLHNLDAVVESIQRISCREIGGLGRRHITVSTVGIVPGIEQLAASGLGVHLAVSLHAPDDATRSRLVPMNRRFKVADILAAAQAYQEKVGRVVTIEYCMLAGVNDSDEQARELGSLLTTFRAHVNLIPYNWIGSGVSGAMYERPTRERMGQFMDILREGGVVAHFRRTRGDEVAAACGQLASGSLPVSTSAGLESPNDETRNPNQ
jgi:23S rRNA (adenine2503-C2)-methyltransferase